MTSGSRSRRARQDSLGRRCSLARGFSRRRTASKGGHLVTTMLLRLMWSWTWLLVGFCACAPHEDISVDADDWTDDKWGSGFSPVYHFLADRPPETTAAAASAAESPPGSINCTQNFWLPSPTLDICWENVAGPEELARSRQLALQNRAALEAVTSSCGVEEGGLSYQRQASDEVQGVLSDHRSVAEALDTMEKVFVSLEEKRKDGKDGRLLASVKEHLTHAKESAWAREHLASALERSLSTLEDNLIHMQLRLHKLIRQ